MGYAVGAVCYRDEAEAAAYYCASMAGFTAEGYVHCAAITPNGTGFDIEMTVDTSTGTVARLVTVQPAYCEPHDVERYAPHLSAFVLGMVLIVTTKMLYRRFFGDQG